MLTRKQKREQEKDTNYFFELVKTQRHFFKDMQERLNKVNDPRHQSYISYDHDLILSMSILKNACDLKSMRSMSEQFNKDECIANIKKILAKDDLEELPHYDTINDFLSKCEPNELERVRTYMIKTLFKKRCFDHYRMNNKYWSIIVDGTGLFSFKERHCEHCLKREFTNEETGEVKVIYMHHVLEAKLVVGNMVLSIASEFIENESEDVPKQDCELKAFYRLAAKLKNTYKRLPICLLGDSLYACDPVFKLCDQYGWKYVLRFKEGSIKTVAREFQALKDIEKDNRVGAICWVNHIAYHEQDVHVFECKIKQKDKIQKTYTYITNVKVTKNNAESLVAAGRSRWKIENEGFNRQKNIRYHIEHANSHNYTAMKNHYLLTQITDILMQLFENGLGILKAIRKTAKEISSNLLEAIRTRRLTDEDISQIKKPMQVRFT